MTDRSAEELWGAIKMTDQVIGLVKLALVLLFLFGVLYFNANRFDSNEIRILIEVAAGILGGKGLMAWLNGKKEQ